MRGERFDTVFPAGRAGFVELKDGRFLAIDAHIDELFRMVSPDGGEHGPTGPLCVTRLATQYRDGTSAVLSSWRLVALPSATSSYMALGPSARPGCWRCVARTTRAERGLRRLLSDCQATGECLITIRWCRPAPVGCCCPCASFGDRRQRTPAMATVNGREYDVEGHAHYPELDIAYIYYSDDEGRTWSRSEGDLFVWLDDGYRGAYACDEPTLAEAKNGRLVMFMRSTVGRIVEAWSADGGWSWSSAVPNDLLSSYSPARIRRIPGTGDLQAVWNQVSAEEIRGGSRRSRLSTAISVDNGVTWKCSKTLACSSALDASPRVAPEQPVSFVIARQHVGEFPNDYSVYHYPNICYANDTVYIIYDRDCVGERTQRKTVVRAFPIEMLYQEEPWDLRLSNEVPPDDGATAIQEAGHVEA